MYIIWLRNCRKDIPNPQEVLPNIVIFHKPQFFIASGSSGDALGTLWDALGVVWECSGMVWDVLGMIWDRFGNPNPTYSINFESGFALGRSGDDV